MVSDHDDKERETARENTDQASSSGDRMQWKFYSANDDDYKIISQDQESDESQTPIAEDQESTDAAGVLRSEPIEPESMVMKPIQDLVSPVLDELEDTILYSITEAKDSDDWERGKQIKPEIQSSSIWKPMISPLGDPNAQLTNECDNTRNDAKRPEIPVDLSTREKIKTPRSKDIVENMAKVNIKNDTNALQFSLLNSSSDDEIPDEETFSTLAAFCQAKVTALYSGMTPEKKSDNCKVRPYKNIITKVSPKPYNKNTVSVIKKDDQGPIASVTKPVLQLVRIDPPPPKMMKLAKPNRVKIDLSMPLCSAIESTTISGIEEESMMQETKSEMLNTGSVNLPAPEITSDVNATPEKKVLWPNIKSLVNTEPCQRANEEPYITMSKVVDTTALEKSADFVQNNLRTEIPMIGSSVQTLSPQQSSQMMVPSAQLNEGLREILTSPRKLTQTPFVPPNPLIQSAPNCKIDLQPGTFPQFVQSMNVVDNCAQNPHVQFSVTTSMLEPTAESSSLITDEATRVDHNVDQISEQATGTDAGSLEKLPSIDQIFKPLAQTSLVTTPTVAANVEVTSLPAVGNSSVHSQVGTDKARYKNLPTIPWESMQATENKTSGRNKNQSNAALATSQATNAYSGWKRLPMINNVPPPYMYRPYLPTHPNYMRWPNPYPWPPYMSMGGRYPSHYPCPVPSYNAYPC